MRPIDADAFKKNMEKMQNVEGWLKPLTTVIIKYIKQKIDDQKTIEQKKGKWINDQCSNCGYGVNPWNNTPYCPNCGAKMEEAE